MRYPGPALMRCLALSASISLALALPAASSSAARLLTGSEIHHVELIDLVEELAISGTAQTAQRASVPSRVAGLVNSVEAKVGDHVSAGTVIAVLDRADLELQLRLQRAAVRSAEVALDLARADLDRQSRLKNAGHVAGAALETLQAEVEKLQASLETAEVQLEMAELDLERTSIKAPISGVITSRALEPGQMIQAGTQLFEILDLSELEVEVMLPFAQSSAVSPGMRARLWLPRKQDQEFKARVTRVAPALTEGSRAARVFLALDNPEGSLPSGVFLTGVLETLRRDDVLAVPAAAIVWDEAATSVMIVADGKVERREVEAVTAPGSKAEMIEIHKGLSAGEVILAAPLTGIAENDPVELRK